MRIYDLAYNDSHSLLHLSNVSAEIFVVCREFLAPKYIDPKFLDPKHVFKELTATTASGADKGTSANNAHENVFKPEKKRRQREGYADGDYTLHKKATASDFIHGTDPIALLGTINQITFGTDEEKECVSYIYILRLTLTAAPDGYH